VDRERWLLKLADLLEANAAEFAEIETIDNGKPLVISQRVDVPSAVDFLRYCAGWATKVEGTTGGAVAHRVPQERVLCLHATRAGGRRGRDHSVELPAADGGVEDRAGARHRLLQSCSSRPRTRR
jgi:hypothetical protein